MKRPYISKVRSIGEVAAQEPLLPEESGLLDWIKTELRGEVRHDPYDPFELWQPFAQHSLNPLSVGDKPGKPGKGESELLIANIQENRAEGPNPLDEFAIAQRQWQWLNRPDTSTRKELAFAFRLLAELSDKRASKDAIPRARIVPTGKRPVLSQRTLCTEWRGGWLHLQNSRGSCAIPMECNKRYCWTCGERRGKRERAELYVGYRMAWDNARCTMGTFTFRTKEANESWEDFQQRWECVEKLPDDWDEFSRYKKYKWLHSLSVPEQIWVRHQMKPQQWLTWLTQCWQEPTQEWKTQFGEPMTFCRTWELTKQGTPHIHAAIRVPKGVRLEQVATFGKEVWNRIRGDEGPGSWEHGADFTNPAGKGLNSAVSYIVKYATKDWTIFHNGQDWNTRLRRVNKSACWPRPEMGDADSFITRDGEIIDKKNYKRAYGKFYYHAVTKETPIELIWAQDQSIIATFFVLWHQWQNKIMQSHIEHNEERVWTPPPEMFRLVAQNPFTGLLEEPKAY